ncbi:MAG: conjugal transfer protein TraE, partial [Clostridia bacterium]|nr:conjugal transfer protein TraE [Clostridia bacterium]
MARNRESKSVPKVKLTRAEKKQLAAIMAQAQKKKGPQTAQQTIPYQRMWPDGICRVTDHYYTKTIQFFDINYQLAQNEDKEAIFEAWCDVLNYFSPDIRFQFSFVNTVASEAAFEQSVIIPPQGDGFDDIREEYTQMLLNQVSKGNNGLQRTKYLTFGLDADNIKTAKPRLEHVELDLLNHLKRLGVKAEPMDGKERLRLMHSMLHMDDPQAEFMFDWKWLAPSGLSTKDFIAPSGLYFKDGRRFHMGGKLASVSFLQIFAAELDDRILVKLLGLESSQIITMHVHSLDHVEAIKLVKSK